MNTYIEATEKAGKEFYLDFLEKKTPIVMLNLLKFRLKADYTNFEAIKLDENISGEKAYEKYYENTLEELHKLGSEILFYGESKNFLIGPSTEKWDAVLLVKHKSLETFMAFSKSAIYLQNVGHRFAGLEDSRLLPINEK